MKSFVCVAALLAASVSAYAAAPDAALLKRARAALTRDFNDPYSAVIEGTFFGKADNGSPVLCGTINGKNRMGGYVGRRNFLYMEVTAGKSGLAMIEGDGMYEVAANFCLR